MKTYSVKEARRNFAQIIQAAQDGGTITITRRGKPVARLGPSSRPPTPALPDMAAFHRRLAFKGKAMSRLVIQARQESRY